MEDVRIILTGLWVAVMLTYLLGDVMRIFAGDFKVAEIDGKKMSQKMLFAMTVLMLLPIIMIVLTLILTNPVNRWINIIMAIFFAGFNLMNLPTYPSPYDRFLFGVGFVFNLLIIWYAWNWV